MILNVYLLILSFFLLGGIFMIFITRRKDQEESGKLWIWYSVYFLVFNILFACTAFNPSLFHYLSILIIFAGYLELIKLFTYSGFSFKGFFVVSIFIYSVLAGCFYLFGLLKMELILYTLLIVSVFDAFSRITGQMFSKRSLLPEISPGKTIEEITCGAICALAASAFLKDLTGTTLFVAFLYTAGIIASALTGDLAASWYRRRYKAREFSKTLPGLGGILDCFCSLIAGGTFMYLLMKFHF